MKNTTQPNLQRTIPLLFRTVSGTYRIVVEQYSELTSSNPDDYIALTYNTQ